MKKFFLGAALLIVATQVFSGEAQLRYTYREEVGKAAFFPSEDGKIFLNLADIAAFYGITVEILVPTQRVLVFKGQREARFLVGGSFLQVGMEEVEGGMVPSFWKDGALWVEKEAARKIVSGVLNLNVRWVDEGHLLIAGGVRRQEVLEEIRGELEKKKPFSLTPQPTAALSDRVAPKPEKVYRVSKVVVDAGHGGHDVGAKGAGGRFFEKEANLDIALRVQRYLEKEKDLEVLMTREKDVFVSLKDRVAFANRQGADLFVSIHCNANRNRNVTGTETYVYSSKASTEEAARAAARENREQDFLDFIQADLRHQAYRARSFLLAEKVDARIRDQLGQKIRRIEQAPFYVLARVDMPSVLIETAFISNPDEEKKLRSASWRDKMAKVIAEGILAYKKHVEGVYAGR